MKRKNITAVIYSDRKSEYPFTAINRCLRKAKFAIFYVLHKRVRFEHKGIGISSFCVLCQLVKQKVNMNVQVSCLYFMFNLVLTKEKISVKRLDKYMF